MSDFAESLMRALAERGDRGLTDPAGLAALDRHVQESKHRLFMRWRTEYGCQVAISYWHRYFGGEPLNER